MIRFAAVVCMALLLLPPAAASAREETCTDVTVIGVAGSGQGGGTGPQVRAVADRVEGILTAARRTVSVRALDYPAIDLVRTLGLALFDGRYRESVDAGITNLEAEVIATTAACPETAVVIIGYSQGAQVARNTLSRLSPAARVAAVALIADPTTTLDDGVVRIGAVGSDRGTLGAVSVPLRIRSRTIDICAPGDVFCGGGRLVIGAHGNGYGAPLSDQAASRIAVLASSTVAARSGYPIASLRWPGALIR
jgi:cutinase